MIVKSNHLIWKDFYVLQTCQLINQLSELQNWEKVVFVLIIEAELFKFKNWHQPFVLKSNFNCKTPSLIYVSICTGCNKEYIGHTGGQLKERLNIYRQRIRQPEYEKIEVERHLQACAKKIIEIFSFFKMKENNKIFRE